MRLLQTISKRTVVVALLMAAAITSALPQDFASWVRSRLDLVLSPLAGTSLEEGGMYVATTLRSRIEELSPPSTQEKAQDELRDENDTLRYALDIERQRHAVQERSYQTKEGLFGQTSDFPCDLVEARVLADDSLPYGSTRTISNSAGKAGAYVLSRQLVHDRSKALPPDLGVIDGRALVGRIIDSGAFTSRLLLVTDRAFKTAALLRRNPAIKRQILVKSGTGMSSKPLTADNNEWFLVTAHGDGKAGLVVTEVFADHNIMRGDWLVTGGDSRFLPDRVRIGKVKDVQPDSAHPGMVTLSIEPYADLGILREVFIVLPLADMTPAGKS